MAKPTAEGSLGVRDQLAQLLRTNAVMRGHFVLSSGQESDYYVDARLVTLSGLGGRLVGQMLHDMTQDDPPDAFAGLTLGADPIITAAAVVATQLDRPTVGLIVRKQAKDHGAGRRVEGPWKPGMRAVVVEDTSTTGGSALEAVTALRNEGIIVQRVITIIDRVQGARERIEAEGLRYEAMFPVDELLNEPESQEQPAAEERVFVNADGASSGNPGPSGAGWTVRNAAGTVMTSGSKYLGVVTNNEAEYRALLLALHAAKELGASRVTVQMDSELVVRQMRQEWKVKNQNLAGLRAQAARQAGEFREVAFTHVPREQNAEADRLASRAAARKW
jgi:orotate phosphoribosyltransferase